MPEPVRPKGRCSRLGELVAVTSKVIAGTLGTYSESLTALERILAVVLSPPPGSCDVVSGW
jgi:hypothetical protein